MPRRKRPGWNPITVTLSDEVLTALRVKAAAHSEDIGTLADRILKASLQPVVHQLPLLLAPLSIAQVEMGEPTKEEASHAEDLEGQFFELVMKCIDQSIGLEEFTESMAGTRASLGLSGTPDEPDVSAMTNDIEAWIDNRRIPKIWQPEVFAELDRESEALSDFFEKMGISPDDFIYET